MSLVIPAAIAWSVFAFGAVYAWAQWPLATAVSVAVGLSAKKIITSGPTAISCGMLAVALATALQLTPLPSSLADQLSPNLSSLLAESDVGYSAGRIDGRSLSVATDATLRSGTFVVLGFVWLMACAVTLRRSGTLLYVSGNIAIIATVLALLGIVQWATFNGKVLWFWDPIFYATNAFGPFVNRNHFAGWMLLAISVSIGLLCGQIARLSLQQKQDWRTRSLWLTSAEASRIVLTASACLVMLIALIWSMSRSGIFSAAVSCVILGTVAVRNMPRSKALVAAGLVGLLLFSGFAWKGVDTLAGWYGRTNTFEWRVDLWNDSLAPLRDFWLTGSGLNTYGVVMLFYPRGDMTVHPQQAHNDYLQLAIEGGLLVGIPVIVLIALFAREVRRRLKQPQDEMTWWIRMGAVAGICGMAVQETVEFSLQIPGVAVLFAVLVAIAIHEPASPRGERLRSRVRA